MDLLRERLRARSHHRACLGGDSSSETKNITQQTDNRIVSGNGSLVVSNANGVTVNTTSTDYGAVLAGKEIARDAIADNTKTSTLAIAASNNAATTAAKAAADAAAMAIKGNTEATKVTADALAYGYGSFASNTRSVFDGALSANADALKLSAGLVEGAMKTTSADTRAVFSQAVDGLGKAYETAKAGDQRVVSMVGLAVVGLAAVFMVPMLLRK